MANEWMSLIQSSLGSIQADQQGIAEALVDLPSPSANAEGGTDASFLQAMKAAVHKVDAMDHLASDKMAAVDSGQSDDLVGAMLSSQQASLSFSMLMQVRNKVMGAVDDLVKLPI